MIPRKYLVHYIKVPEDPKEAFEESNGTVYNKYVWVRIGQHLEAFAEELNPQTNIVQNIWGYQSVVHNGYQVQSAVDTFYATSDTTDNDYYLYKYVEYLALHRSTGDNCKTERVEALINIDGIENASNSDPVPVDWAWKEDCYVTPQSLGGDTSGFQIPFQISNLGNRREVEISKNQQGQILVTEIDND